MNEIHQGYKTGDFRDNEVTVHRAGCVGPSHVPTFSIVGGVEMPDAHSSVDMARNVGIFENEAKDIADVLFASLPGGTLDRLIAEMLQRKASQFIVAFGSLREAIQS